MRLLALHTPTQRPKPPLVSAPAPQQHAPNARTHQQTRVADPHCARARTCMCFDALRCSNSMDSMPRRRVTQPSWSRSSHMHDMLRRDLRKWGSVVPQGKGKQGGQEGVGGGSSALSGAVPNGINLHIRGRGCMSCARKPRGAGRCRCVRACVRALEGGGKVGHGFARCAVGTATGSACPLPLGPQPQPALPHTAAHARLPTAQRSAVQPPPPPVPFPITRLP